MDAELTTDERELMDANELEYLRNELKEQKIRYESLLTNCKGLGDVNEQLRIALLAEKRKSVDAEKALNDLRMDLLNRIGKG